MSISWSSMDWPTFVTARDQALQVNPGLMNAANTNVYAWRQQRHSPQSGGEQAQYRCHVAEAWLDSMNLDRIDTSHLLVGRGVRHSLSLLMQLMDKRKLIRPHDVYPEYARIQAASGAMMLETYEARKGLPWDILEQHKGWALLVCDPLKPWVDSLTQEEWERLVDQAGRNDGQVWIDSAYQAAPSTRTQDYIRRDLPVAWLGSLSKGWLLPGIFGGVIASKPLSDAWRGRFQQEPKDVALLRQAWHVLKQYPTQPEITERHCTQARETLLQALKENGLSRGACDPGRDYFLTHKHSVEVLAKEGIMAIPPSVFCDPGQAEPNAGSILSAVNMGPLGQLP